ncbi:hypothetical protein [Variovorax rhizosphaerae]|uniref:Uncharacterized protein n=1 Tax=Variovorax rhizosphaerae TaxID=1836200 RepID=A0ABU8X1J4_9BURK
MDKPFSIAQFDHRLETALFSMSPPRHSQRREFVDFCLPKVNFQLSPWPVHDFVDNLEGQRAEAALRLAFHTVPSE